MSVHRADRVLTRLGCDGIGMVDTQFAHEAQHPPPGACQNSAIPILRWTPTGLATRRTAATILTRVAGATNVPTLPTAIVPRTPTVDASIAATYGRLAAATGPGVTPPRIATVVETARITCRAWIPTGSTATRTLVHRRLVQLRTSAA